MTTPADISGEALATIRHTRDSLKTALEGRSVRVISDHNGQPFGRSKKSWKGEICKIVRIHVDIDEGMSLVLEGHEYGECFIPANQVEFV